MVQKMDFTQMTSNMNYQSFLDALNAFKGWFGGLELIFQILVIVALVAATVGVLVLIGYIIKGIFWLIGQIIKLFVAIFKAIFGIGKTKGKTAVIQPSVVTEAQATTKPHQKQSQTAVNVEKTVQTVKGNNTSARAQLKITFKRFFVPRVVKHLPRKCLI